MPTTVTCPGCGGFVPLGDRFCGACGTPISGSALMSGEGARFDPWEELLQKLRQATIGEYEIKGELGRGGMAAVLLAHDLQLNRKVAIKVMLPGLVYGASMWDRFLSEARTAAKLDHPNIIYIHSVKEKDRFLYFVMKYIDGRPLDDILAQHDKLPIPVAQTILVEVARALDYAHHEGVVHRDIKPANIMIDQKGTSIVMDFGIARATDEKRFTQTGATIGTPAYMSPEQCRGHETTAASDQYSLGILAYEMLAGGAPFSGTPIELQIAHMQDSARPLRDLRPELSLELSGAVMRMLAKDPADRWPSLAQLVPIFGRGLDPNDDTARNLLTTLVREGAARRKAFPATPVSLAPASLSANASAAAAAATTPVPLPREEPQVSLASALSVPAEASSPPPPQELRASGRIELTLPEKEPITASPIDLVAVPAAGPPPAARRPNRLLIGAGATLGAILLVVAFSRGGKKKEVPVAAPAAETTAAPTAPPPDASAFGDSVVIGHGADAIALVKGKAPRTVKTDAVSLLVLAVSKTRIAVGDTVRVRLDVQDDSGDHVTTPQILWTTSNPRVVHFLAPGQLLAGGAGKSTITVTAGAITTSQVVTVVEAKAAPSSKTPRSKRGGP